MLSVIRDLDQDGENEILLGTQNYELHVYDAALDLIPVAAVQLGEAIVVAAGSRVHCFQVSQLVSRSADGCLTVYGPSTRAHNGL